MWTYMWNHRNWGGILFSLSVLLLNPGFELSSAAKSHVCQEKFHINLEIFCGFSEKISCIARKEWYNSRRNCPATLRAALKIGLRGEEVRPLKSIFICLLKKDALASAPTKKGPDRGQVQLSFASVILSWKEVKRRVVMFRHQSHKGRLDILNRGEGLSPIAYRRCSGS